jgi:hypothetical protein
MVEGSGIRNYGQLVREVCLGASSLPEGDSTDLGWIPFSQQ